MPNANLIYIGYSLNTTRDLTTEESSNIKGHIKQLQI